ncbi:hypothetical protein [Clostridium chromiireducens]|uniref:Uncharacterized protein n=1 Tax=Clostridium chromiireducens TaxID=225345 RepID=A0A1V4ICQ4_9CLOT|nr:hypothetical protein [Clostridium chromiireducens]OPJ57788.1 hypothetical protein CLCHR_42400 [Clostridium chromiireducens]
MSDNTDNKKMNEVGKSLLAQRKQMESAERQLVKASQEISNLGVLNDDNLSELDKLLMQAEMLCSAQGMDTSQISEKHIEMGEKLVELSEKEKADIKVPAFEELVTIAIDDTTSWDEYLSNIDKFALENNIDLTVDPFENLLSQAQKAEIAERIRSDYTMKKANCDKYDYMIAAFCGVVAGLIDSFFVGMPDQSKLGKWTNNQTDKFVEKIAKIKGWNPEAGNENSISNAIQFLEKKYKVSYDQATSKAAGDLLGMTPGNHHIKSLGHSPDLVGLIFAIVDQFTSTSHFLDNGRLIVFDTETSSLHGKTFIAKLFCGFSNWLGHLISDVAGSSSGRRNNPDKSGSGIPMPFFELFQLCNKGNFKIYPGSDKSNNPTEVSLADLSVKIFENHYDARFGMAQAIPVVINEISIRLLWAIKSRFYSNKSWKECIPIGSHPDLRRMLLTGHGVLCLVDGIDAAARSKGQILLFALHLNFVAWKRLAFSGLMEIRALYKENALDIAALDEDLRNEWNRLYENSGVVF